MAKTRFRILLADTNILIDLNHAGMLPLLKRIRDALDVRAIDSVEEELRPENLPYSLDAYGFEILSTTRNLEWTLKIAALRSTMRALSTTDVELLIVAELESLTLWTNDTALQRQAALRNIDTCFLFAPLLEALRCRIFCKTDLLHLLSALASFDPRHYPAALVTQIKAQIEAAASLPRK